MDARTIDEPQSASETPDDVLVGRAREGDARAFEKLVRRHNQRVFRTARAVLGSDADAQDAAQQAWLAIYVNLAQWSASGPFHAWALRIVVRTCLRGRSWMRGMDELDDERIEGKGATPEDEAHRLEMRRVLERAVDDLSPALRTVLVLSDVEGLSGPEISEALGASEEAVRVRLHRARRALRGAFEERFEHERRGLFPFLGARCDAITAAVLEAIERTRARG